MPHCENCGSHISAKYARVMYQDHEGIPFCFHCPDKSHNSMVNR